MKVDYNRVMSVLAMFDREDISYIKSETFLKTIGKKNTKNENKIMVKKLGDNHDGSRK